MPDPIAPAGEAPPPATGASAVPPAAGAVPAAQAPLPLPMPAVAPPPAAQSAKTFDEATVKQMIAAAEGERERAILKGLGVAEAKDAKAAIEAWRKAEEANKTELQKAIEKAAAHEADANALGGYKTKLESMVKADLDKLTPEQRGAVQRLAGEDPLKVADAIEVLRPTWAQLAPAVTTTAAPGAATIAAPPPMAPPANSGVPPAAPRPGTPKSKWDEFDQLRTNNDPRANAFYTLHSHAIEASRPN
jgi:hypothetical protein